MAEIHADREARIVELEHEFANLDTTLVRAIAADLDPLYSLAQLRETLSTLALETEADDYDGSFDPSGMGGMSGGTSRDETDGSTEQSKDSGQQTDPLTVSSLSGDESPGEEDSEQYRAYTAPMVHLEDGEKIEKLALMFPGEPTARIEFLLTKAHGDFTKTMDTLLNQTFMASATPSKGVDGFLEERVFATKKKGKKHKDQDHSKRGQRLDIGSGAYKKPEIEIEGAPTQSTKRGSPRRPTETSLFSANTATSSPYLSAADASSAWTEQIRKANAAHRNASLGRYAGAAASYYHSEAASLRQAHDALSRADAERLVAASATAGQIDLHGVTVGHATRIAAARTRAWWDALGDERKFRAHLRAQNEFRIITGIGNHSVGGVGKLGPAVSKRLLADGWKVSIGRGFVCVTGPARSK